ncbi:DUF418 domain-containing protein [Pseudoalteromonas sp. ASV78]|uniref:DUF418 domain-containing protein n=1 Tax=Pseudoalteromonas sp. ASV78 TaxID=3397851 RepID=UPI0039FDAE83
MRNHNMDIIRGVAVLGLMYMNAYFFGLFEFGYVPLTNPPLSDHIIQCFSLIFIDGRFRSLFCLLFGAGLYIQWQRWQSHEKLIKRLKILAVLGLLHGFLLWAGDILLIYACAGWLAAKYLTADATLILKRGVQFLLLGATITFLISLLEPSYVISRDADTFIDSYQALHATFSTLFINNVLMFVLMLIALPLVTLWMAAGLMLIGIYLYKQGLFVSGFATQSCVFITAAALLLSLFRLLLQWQYSPLSYALQEPVNWLAALFTALLYIQLIVKLCANKAASVPVLQTAGRLALSLYISQSVMLFVLFKVIFPEWVLSFNLLDYWLLVTGLVLLQILVCAIYPRYYNDGPLEALWRRLS